MKVSLKSVLLLLATTLLLVNYSCKKNTNGDNIVHPPTNEEVPSFDQELTTASVQGYIVQEDGLPIFNAIVNCGTNTTITDGNGYFGFNNIQISKNNGFVKVTKQGYFNGSKSFVVQNNHNNNLKIQLLSKLKTGTIAAKIGGTVSLPTGAFVTLPSDAVIKQTDSSIYNGDITVSLAWINPTDLKLSNQMPGDLRGITTSGEENALQSFGMLAVELSDNTGQLLQIAPGKKASISIPIPPSIAENAPSSIPLWYFNEKIGRWKEEGSAIKSGDKYIGEVSHFSFWNWDVKFPAIEFSLKVVTTENKPVSHLMVQLVGTDNNLSSFGITDSTGFVSGKIPMNLQFALNMVGPCGGIFYTQNIGPFAADVNIGSIAVTNPTKDAFSTISGKLIGCDNVPIANGVSQIFVGYESFFINADANGDFNITVPVCSNNLSFAVRGPTLRDPSIVLPVKANNIVGEWKSCPDLSDITYTFDSTVVNFYGAYSGNFGFKSGEFADTHTTNTDKTTTTKITGGITSVGSSKSIDFSFIHTGFQAGTYQLKSFSSSAFYSWMLNIDPAFTSPVVTITSPFANIGDYITGYFNIQAKNVLSPYTSAPLVCNFKVKRKS